MIFSSTLTDGPESRQIRFRRAVVIGGSVAGLTAARALSNHFEQVTVIERGPFADGIDFPKGVPQSRHPHALLIRGEQILEDFFPGFRKSLISGGAQPLNFGRDFNIRMPDGWLPHYETDMEAIATSRRLLDHTLYQRLVFHPRISFRPYSEMKELCTDGINQAVVGVQIYNRESKEIDEIPAEFVVDASGRSSRAPEWLAQLGIQPPQEQTVNAFPGYSTRIYKAPAEQAEQAQTLYIMPNPPAVSRGAIVMPLEDGHLHVTLIGMNGDYPPTDDDGFLAFARSLVSPKVADLIQTAEPASPIWGYRNAANRLRRFDRLERYLEGFVVLGDAVYALNPVYGQGITLAAIGSQLLDELLAEHVSIKRQSAFEGLAETFQKRLAKTLKMPWQTATNEDMRWPNTEGKQALDPISKLLGGYFKMVLNAMPHSSKVTNAFYHVQHMIAPPTVLMRPGVVAEVLKTNWALK
ncbi:MAG: FAD-dependent monooxygenase [Chloroflexota bacterium]